MQESRPVERHLGAAQQYLPQCGKKKPGNPDGRPGEKSLNSEPYFFLGTLMTGVMSAPQMVPSPFSNKVLVPLTTTFLLS